MEVPQEHRVGFHLLCGRSHLAHLSPWRPASGSLCRSSTGLSRPHLLSSPGAVGSRLLQFFSLCALLSSARAAEYPSFLCWGGGAFLTATLGTSGHQSHRSLGPLGPWE